MFRTLMETPECFQCTWTWTDSLPKKYVLRVFLRSSRAAARGHTRSRPRTVLHTPLHSNPGKLVHTVTFDMLRPFDVSNLGDWRRPQD